MVRGKPFVNFWGSFILDWFEHLQDHDLNSTDYKTLFFLCEQINHDNNVVYLKQKQIAEHLNTNKGNISRSIKKLKEKQFIAKCANGFMVNPHLFYVGRNAALKREDLRRDFDKLVLENEGTIRFHMNEEEIKLEERSQEDYEKVKDMF